MFDLTTAEWAALDLIAKSRTPWVRLSLVKLAGGQAAVDRLVELKLIKPWTTMVVDERKHEKARGWRPTRARRMDFVAMTGLGESLMETDIFERTDGGLPHHDRRRKTEAGIWVLPDTPIHSNGGGMRSTVCPDQTPDQPDEPARARRVRSRRAG